MLSDPVSLGGEEYYGQKILATEDGGYLLFFGQFDVGLFAQKFNADGEKIGSEFNIALEADATYNPQINLSSVEFTDNGNLLVVWSQNVDEVDSVPEVFSREFSIPMVGTTGADTLSGTDFDDVIVGLGGADIVLANGGDDIIKTEDLNFVSVNGGLGQDALVLEGAGINFDLMALADDKIQDIEVININGEGNNSLVIGLQDVLASTDDNNLLAIEGDAGDTVTSTAQGWIAGADQEIDGELYHAYTSGGATLLIDVDIIQNIT